jgi:hypothetical protein
VPIERHGRIRPLVVRDGAVYASRGLCLFKMIDSDDRRKIVSFGGYIKSALSRVWHMERIARADIRSMSIRADGKALLIADGSIVCMDANIENVASVFPVPGGGRPLGIENSPDGFSYFGEYSANKARNPMSIYGTADGIHWEVAYEFPRSSIRHVHGIIYDEIREGFWVLTGDDADEAGIWFTDNNFKDLTPVSRGTQQSRAVTVFPVDSGLIVPMDTPQERNYINHYDIERDRYEKLASIPGSSLASTRDGNCMLISTAVERSKVNLEQRSTVFGSVDGQDWKAVAKLNRDWKIVRNMRPYLQHPNIRFAGSDGSVDRVYASCMAIEGFDGEMISWDRRDLTNYLEGTSIL